MNVFEELQVYFQNKNNYVEGSYLQHKNRIILIIYQIKEYNIF